MVGSRFFRNNCDPTGPDLGGGAIRVVAAPEGQPAYVVNSTFGGPDVWNECSNGGAISGLHASIAVYNSVITHNRAIGYGANPARAGTPGGGSGGAIYADGNPPPDPALPPCVVRLRRPVTWAVEVAGSVVEDNHPPDPTLPPCVVATTSPL